MKTIVATLMLSACTVFAEGVGDAEYQILHSAIKQLAAGNSDGANAEMKTLSMVNPAFARSITEDAFKVPCKTCSGDGLKTTPCPRCDGSGNASAMKGFKSACTSCNKGWKDLVCSDCSGSGKKLDADALDFLNEKLLEHFADTESILAAWELSQKDMERKRSAYLQKTQIQGKIAQIDEDGIYVFHRDDRVYLVGIRTDGLYDGQQVLCEAWPIGTKSYTSVLGANLTVRKYTADFWSDW